MAYLLHYLASVFRFISSAKKIISFTFRACGVAHARGGIVFTFAVFKLFPVFTRVSDESSIRRVLYRFLEILMCSTVAA